MINLGMLAANIGCFGYMISDPLNLAVVSLLSAMRHVSLLRNARY